MPPLVLASLGLLAGGCATPVDVVSPNAPVVPSGDASATAARDTSTGETTVGTAPSIGTPVASAETPSNDVAPRTTIRSARLPDDGEPRLPTTSLDGRSRIATADAEGSARLDAIFRRARVLIERASGTDLSAIDLRLVDDATILAEVGVETRRLVGGQLGDGPLAERLLGTLLGDQGGTYAALYSGRHRAVMISREVLDGYLASLPPDAAVRDEALLVLMLHELVHAADDLRHAIHANRVLDFRASFAQSAAFEGHAQWLTRKICRREGCLGGLDALDRFMFDGPGGADGRVGLPSAPVDRNLLEYSYVEGERFVAALAARPDGERLLEEMLANPPRDPLQILDPGSFPDTARERRNRALLDAALAVDHPWLGDVEPRVPVATSPLKGVNLRGDPSRRAAAIDGFTRLVTAMVAVQFHDAGPLARTPIEVTLMRTDRPTTARLFADTLHAHARVRGTDVAASSPPPADAATDTAADGSGRLPALSRTVLPADGGAPWRTAIAASGPFVVQASGRAPTSAPMDDYVLGVLAALLDEGPA